MQTRTCFNGGELAPEMAARCDVDVYMRGCQVLENWDVNQMGGVRRRRGMRDVCAALDGDSRLFSYVYSHVSADAVFLVEVAEDAVRVLDAAGAEVAHFESAVGGVTEFWLNVGEVRVCQLNALLFITCRECWPLVLSWDGDDAWSLKRVDFKEFAWRYDHEARKTAVVVRAEAGDLDAVYSVTFDEGEDAGELPDGEDVLRASFWLEQAEAFVPGATLRAGVRVVEGIEACEQWDRIAIHGDTTLRYWVCKKEFPADTYVVGLDDPASYPDNFELSESVAGFEGDAALQVVTSVHELGKVDKGTRFAVKSGYWEYFTCVKTFTEDDMVAGQTDYAAYTGFFVRGIAVGEALPCRGKWEFYCSGLWYGSYEVRRSYEGSGIEKEWETAGISFSRVSEAENLQLAGDESDEECWLRLFLTRSKYMTDDLANGFPPDSCGNRLIVSGYRHDMVLEHDAYGEWRCRDRVKVAWRGTRTVYDWSWAAFSERYGFPQQCEVYQQRLVFASTVAQPQCIWMSRVDDYYNFATGDSDAAAIVLELFSTSQDPVCWLLEYKRMLMVGTTDAEWVIESRDGVVRPGGLNVSRHGRVGSDSGLMLPAEDKALFVERGGGRLWEFGYSFEVDGCRSTDMTVFAPHVLRDHGGVRSAALLRKPDTVAVFAMDDGQVALMTYNTMHQVHAWHRWVTDGRVLSVCALPGGVRSDRLFMLVERDEVVRIEVMDEESEYEDAGGRAYTSLLITNALGNALEERVQRRPKVPAMLMLGAPLAADQLEVCADGGSWARVALVCEVLPSGWNEVLMFNRWELEHAIGIRVTGGGASILALQG